MASVTARESPARRVWSHEICRASNSTLAYMASVTAREEADVKEEKDTIRHSGVGTVAAVAALAATLFRPKINIHNLLKLLYK